MPVSRDFVFCSALERWFYLLYLHIAYTSSLAARQIGALTKEIRSVSKTGRIVRIDIIRDVLYYYIRDRTNFHCNMYSYLIRTSNKEVLYITNEATSFHM